VPDARRSKSRSGLRSVTAALVAAAIAGLAAASSWAAGVSIPLPSQADAASALPDPNLLVGNAGDAFTRVPGPVDDTEIVHIATAPDGAPVSVVVDQTLTVHGTGDYRFSIQGPATDVRAPLEQRVQPGLRQGRIIWQGFSVGSETLRATATLDMTFERPRLPLAVRVAVTRRGRPVAPPYDGPVDIDVGITNTTALPVPVRLGVPDRAALGNLLDAMRARLRSGGTPAAGVGLPRELPGSVADAASQLDVPAAFRVAGTVAFASGTLSNVTATGAGVAGPDTYGFAARTPSSSGDVHLRLRGTAKNLRSVLLSFTADPQPPDPHALDLPAGASWRSTLANASSATLRRALVLADTVLWQALRTREFRAHLGAPRLSSASARYAYATAPAAALPSTRGSRGLRPTGIALALVALAGVVANATAIWLRS
jgi:hypothetical protein